MEPCATEQKNWKNATLLTTEEENCSNLLSTLVATSNDAGNPPIQASILGEPAADVTPLCMECRAQAFVKLARAKILTDDFILSIDEYSFKAFPVAFAMYNAFYWMDYL